MSQAAAPQIGERFDDEAVQIAQAEAQQLCKEVPGVNLAATMLIVARQLYHVGRFALMRNLAEHKAHPATEEAIVQAMAQRGDTQFQLEDLQKGLNFVVPFMQSELKLANAQRARELQTERTNEEQQRRAATLHLGFSRGQRRNCELQRDRTLLLVGSPQALKLLSDRIGTTATTSLHEGKKVVAVRLGRSHSSGNGRIEANRVLVDVSVNRWIGAANTPKKLAEFLHSWRKQTYKNRIDLLLCEYVSELYTSGISGRGRVRNAESAHRHLRKWADDNGAGLVIMLPLQEDHQQNLREVDEAGEAAEQLDEHTEMLFVQLRTGTGSQDGQPEIWVGTGAEALRIDPAHWST